MELAGKIALVTGAAIRVGRETALELARAGADLLIHYRSSQGKAEQTADAIRGLGRRAATVQADFAQPAEACDRLIAAIDREFGRIDVLVNNASAYFPGSPASLPAEQWALLWAVNVTAPTMLAERMGERMTGREEDAGTPGHRDAGTGEETVSAFVPASRRLGATVPASIPATERGVIINMLDLQARIPWPRHLGGGITAGAMWSATVGLARRFAPTVRVNGVAPGTVLWNEQDDPSLHQRIIELTPLRRTGEPKDVAKAVRFLIENDYITGQVLCVDGGRSMG